MSASETFDHIIGENANCIAQTINNIIGQNGYDVTAAVIPDLRKGPDARMRALIEAAVRAARMAVEGDG